MIVVSAVLIPSPTTAQNWSGALEIYQYVPNKSAQFYVFRNITWRKGTPEPDFIGDPTQTKVAILDSTLHSIPDSLFEKFPQLQWLVVRNTTLELLPIMSHMERVYAEGNRIKTLLIKGGLGERLKQLHLRNNPFGDIETIRQQRFNGLEVLDLSGTDITEKSDNTVDIRWFSRMPNLTELRLANVDAYYFENVGKKTLPNVKLLDLSGNPITPVNFQLEVFRALPVLEELDLRNATMTDLSVSVAVTRSNFPSLQRIYLDGNDFKCDLLQALLAHLKTNGIEVPLGNPDKCILGYEKYEGLCCKSSLLVVETKATTVWPGQESTTEQHGRETPNQPDKKDQVVPIEQHNIGLWVACIVAGILIIAAIATIIVIRHIKLRQQPVPTEDHEIQNLFRHYGFPSEDDNTSPKRPPTPRAGPVSSVTFVVLFEAFYNSRLRLKALLRKYDSGIGEVSDDGCFGLPSLGGESFDLTTSSGRIITSSSESLSSSRSSHSFGSCFTLSDRLLLLNRAAAPWAIARIELACRSRWMAAIANRFCSSSASRADVPESDATSTADCASGFSDERPATEPSCEPDKPRIFNSSPLRSTSSTLYSGTDDCPVYMYCISICIVWCDMLPGSTTYVLEFCGTFSLSKMFAKYCAKGNIG
uniref:Leucine rich immune protein (Coil-less) n=1 Tax=Anopheles farauti TaxID=69004 RepID=A0A182QN00_9DIPT